jgi:hypothetical protein
MLKTQPSPPPREIPRHSRLSVASFGLALVALLLAGLFFLFAYVLTVNTTNVPSRGTAAAGLVLVGAAGLTSLTGIGFGIGSLFRPAQRKVYGYLGIIFNVMILASLIILTVLGMVMTVASAT